MAKDRALLRDPGAWTQLPNSSMTGQRTATPSLQSATACLKTRRSRCKSAIFASTLVI